MATVRELITKIGFEVDESGLKKGQDRLHKFKRTAKIAMTAVAGAIVGIGVSAIKSAANIEALETQFEVMLGSAEKARDMMEDLNKFSLVTPFEPTDLAKATTTLLNFGVAGEDIMGTLQMLGDVSLGNKQKFNSLALVFGQIQSTGRLMGQDLLQLINAGFNPLQVISKKTGKSVAVLKEEMSKGKISAQAVTEAFKTASSEGGMFFQGMLKGSKTFKGVMSTVKGAIDLALASIGKEMIPVLKEYAQEVIKIADETAKWAKTNREKIAKGFKTVIRIVWRLIKILLWFGKVLKIVFIDTPIGAILLGMIATYKAYAIAVGIATVAQALFNKEITTGIGKTALLNTKLLTLLKNIGGRLGIVGLLVGGAMGMKFLSDKIEDHTVLGAHKRLKERAMGMGKPTAEEASSRGFGAGFAPIVNQKNQFSITAPQGPRAGETGLTPKGISKIATQAMKKSLNTELRNVLVASQ
jgi:tape measure domain-containing protein